jgi:hypothetical protein
MSRCKGYYLVLGADTGLSQYRSFDAAAAWIKEILGPLLASSSEVIDDTVIIEP